MKPIFDIGLNDIKTVLANKGYKTFTAEGIPNIVGIRNSIKSSNNYDDRCWVWWMENGIEQVHNYTVTTHPGYYFLQHPLAHTDGTAILVPGQYLDCWVLGMHRGVQLALCQLAGIVRVYRDDNLDLNLNYNPATIQSGYFGINLHHGALDNSDIVDRHSAGCQVWRYANQEDF